MEKEFKYISQEQQEEFERFLLHQMELEEETAFNQKLKEDIILKEQFEEFKALFFVVEEDGLRRQLDKFHKGLEERNVLKKSNFNLYRIAAGMAILVALGVWVFNRPNKNERLFNEYFTPDPGLPTVMGNSDNYAFYEAMVDYKQGNYDTAINKWEALLQKKPGNDTLNYFLGVAHLANKNETAAINYLNRPNFSKESIFYEDIHLYLGLALLKEGDIPKAKIALSKNRSPKGKSIRSQLK